MIGEYKRLDRDIDGAVALQKRNGDDFYLRYHAQGALNFYSLIYNRKRSGVVLADKGIPKLAD